MKVRSDLFLKRQSLMPRPSYPYTRKRTSPKRRRFGLGGMSNPWNQVVHSVRKPHCPSTLPSIAGHSSLSLSSSTLLFLLLLPSFAALIERGRVWPGAECHLQLLNPAPVADAAYVRAVDVHREDEGPAGEVGIDRVTLESYGMEPSLVRSELLTEYLPLSAESLVGRGR